MKPICKDLADEYDRLDAIVSPLDENGWSTVTHCAGWTVKEAICHIAYFDNTARMSATDPEAFARHAKELFSGITSMDDFNERTLADGRDMSAIELLTWWRDERMQLLKAFEALDPKTRLPWYGPPMSARSSATARIMETWAHGQDIIDALNISRAPSPGLKHIAHLGVRTFGWSFSNRGMTVPDAPVRVELTGPSGERWDWGPETAADRITGPAEDFCLVVTQRRHVDDTDLQTTGDISRKWMEVAQAFAGPPDNGPPAGMFSK